MNLNSELESKFNENGIDVDVGFNCLLGIYFNLDITKYISQMTLIKLDQVNLINKNYKTNKYVINVDLFKEPDMGWLDDYRGLFRGISPGSMGDRQGVAKKMKKFMKTSKHTPEEILAATSWYINNTDPRYIMRAHYFIEKNGSSTLGATLEEADFGDLTDDLFNNTL